MSRHRFKLDRIANTRGFTLIEVLFAMAIATFGFLCLALMQGVSSQGNLIGNRITQATFVAQQGIELAKATHYDPVDMVKFPLGALLAPDADQPVAPVVEANIDESGAPGGIFTRLTTHTSNTKFSRIVTVQVTWTEAGYDSRTDTAAAQHNVTLTTTTRGDGN